MSERIFRVISLGLFIIGFVVGIASSDKPQGVLKPVEHGPTAQELDATNPKKARKSLSLKAALTTPVSTLIEDMRMADEINALNEGRWNQDVHVNTQDGLARVQKILEAQSAEEMVAATK